MFGSEFFVAGNAIFGNSQHSRAGIGKGRTSLGKRDGFRRAARRIIAGVEKQDNRATAQVGQAHGFASVAGQGEIGGKIGNVGHRETPLTADGTVDFTIDRDRQQQEGIETPEPAAVGLRRAVRRARRLALWTLFATGLTSVAAGIAVVLLIGQTLHAPDWLRARIETRIEQDIGGLQVGFGDLTLVVNKGWRPRLHLRDVTLAAPDGQHIARLADAEASLAMRPLLRGRIEPRDVLLSGLFATLRRDPDGGFALLLGAENAPFKTAASLPQLLAHWTETLARPQFLALTSFDIKALTLRYEDARQGRVWTLDGGQIELARNGDELRAISSFALLSGGDYASAVEAGYTTRIGDQAARFGVSVRDIHSSDIAAQSVALGWLDVLRAPISGGLRGSVDEKGALGPLSATLAIGAGVLQPTDQTSPIPFSSARSNFTYAPDEQVLTFDELSVVSDWGSGSAEGRAYLDGIEGGRLSGLTGQFTFGALDLNPAELYDSPIQLKGAAADFQLDLDPFRLTLGQMHVADAQTQVQVSGAFSAEQSGWQLAVDGRVDQLTPERLVELWPASVLHKPRKWLAENLSHGRLNDIDIALRLQPGHKPDVYVDFDFSGGNVRFLKTMPPITGAAGQATLIDHRLVVTATEGQVTPEQGGPLEIAGTSFIIPDTTIRKAAPAIVELNVAGAVTSALSLLNRPPLRVLKSTDLPVDLAKGQVQLTGSLHMPLKKGVPIEEFAFTFDGTITDAQSTVLVPSQPLAFPSLRIKGDQGGLTLGGAGTIGPVPLDIVWHQKLGKDVGGHSRVTGQVELSPRALEAFAIGLPPGSISGLGKGDFTLALRKNEPPSLDLTSDLVGLGLSIPQLGWSKPAGSKGMFQMAATLGPAARVDRMQLQAAGLAATGAVVTRPGAGLDRALLSSVRVGDWLEASVELIGRGAKAAPDIHVLNGTLDLRRAQFGGGKGADGGQMDIALDRVQINDTIALTGFQGRFRNAGGMAGSFTARINDGTGIAGQIAPQSGRSAVRLQSEDAGGVIRSAGLLTQGRGGRFDMTLTPTGDPGQFDGVVRITDTRVTDAPAMAALLDAVSIVGLLDELSGRGIYFAEVDAKFRLTPSQLTLFSSSAVGPSIGLSMDGTYDVARKLFDMRGVISPVYLLNSIGSFLTRKGEGVFGFNYTLSGPAASPKVQINPLSALMPGMLRDVFRSAPPPVDETAPPPAPRRERRDPSKGRGGVR